MSRVMKTVDMKIAAIALGALLASGCSTQKIYTTNQATLVSALNDLESGEATRLKRAEASARSVLVATGGVEKDYRVQRFFAQYLMARSHMEASAGGAFLTEPKQKSAVSLGNGPSQQPSPVAHLVATSYHAGYGLDWYATAVGQPLTVEKQALLPPELEALGVEGAGKHLQLCLLATYSRLQFEEQSNIILEAIGATDLQALEGIVDAGAASPSMKPWIYRAMWNRLKKKEPREAYKFAARALESADDLKLGADNVHGQAISQWFSSTSHRFVCPDCETEVRVDSRKCKSCRGSEWRDAVFDEGTGEDE